MKQCPDCRTTYTDETLRFCLQEGGTLVEVAEAETVIRPGVRVDVPSTNYPTIKTAPTKGSPIIKIVVAVLIVGFLGLVVLGGAGAIFYLRSAGTTLAVASPTPTASPTRSPSPTPTPEAEDERLEQEIANLQKQLEDALDPSPTKPHPVSRVTIYLQHVLMHQVTDFSLSVASPILKRALDLLRSLTVPS